MLLEKEAQRLKKREQFLENHKEKLSTLNNLIQEKELELRNHYQLLEGKLKTNI